MVLGREEAPARPLPFARPPSASYIPPAPAVLPLFTQLDSGEDGGVAVDVVDAASDEVRKRRIISILLQNFSL